jgi:hypothetical protein
VQADRGLVEHVEHADQARTDLGGQPDALGLAAGQRARRPVQRQVVEADVEQEAEAGVDLLEHPLGDLPFAVAELETGRKSAVSPIGIAQTSAMFSPPSSPSVTASETGLSRAPSQAGHGTSRM